MTTVTRGLSPVVESICKHIDHEGEAAVGAGCAGHEPLMTQRYKPMDRSPQGSVVVDDLRLAQAKRSENDVPRTSHVLDPCGQFFVPLGTSQRAGIQTVTFASERRVGVGQRMERVATGPAHRGATKPLTEFIQRQQREFAAEAVETIHVGIYRLAPDTEPCRQPRQSESREALLIHQLCRSFYNRGSIERNDSSHSSPRQKSARAVRSRIDRCAAVSTV